MHFKDDIAVMNISRCIPVVGKIRYSHQVFDQPIYYFTLYSFLLEFISYRGNQQVELLLLLENSF